MESVVGCRHCYYYALFPGPVGNAGSLQGENGPASTGKEPGQASLGDMGELYWPLFVAMLLGMLAKAGVDWLDA